MRKILAKDFGALSKILYKLGIREEIKKLFFVAGKLNKKEQEAKNTELMIDLVLILTENYWKAEKETLDLLASLSGRKDIEQFTISEIQEMFIELAKDEGFQSFLESIAK